jgi:2-oxoglutarate ferredoxin oxidoreductase subunit delta
MAEEVLEEVVEAAGEQPAKSKAAKRKRRKRGQVTLFPNWCKGCGLCVGFCPTKVLEQSETGHVSVAHPERCTACHFCELHCPDFAIFVTEVDPEEEA